MIFKRQLDYKTYAKIQEKLHLYPGFFAEVHTERIYPYGSSAHVLGYVGKVDSQDIKKDSYYTDQDINGKTGLEKTYEKYLSGIKGMKYTVA